MSNKATLEHLSDDAALFRAAIGPVHPLNHPMRVDLTPTVKKPIIVKPKQAQAHINDILSDFLPEETTTEYLSNGVSRLVFKKLRNQPIHSKLDLHGHTTNTARQRLQQFISHAKERDVRSVIIIHGKGMNSRNGEAILPKLTRHWLSQHPDVLAFCNAPPEHGGSGAALALLKSNN